MLINLNKQCQYTLIHESASMKGSFIFLGCSCVNDFISYFIISVDVNLLQHSLLIFIRANPLSWLLVMVERWLVLISLSWQKLFSLSHDVIVNVKANRSNTCKLGNCKALQECKASINLLGMSAPAACCCFYLTIHMLYSVDNIAQ